MQLKSVNSLIYSNNWFKNGKLSVKLNLWLFSLLIIIYKGEILRFVDSIDKIKWQNDCFSKSLFIFAAE